MASTDEHHLAQHQSTQTANIIYSKINGTENLNQSHKNHPSSGIDLTSDHKQTCSTPPHSSLPHETDNYTNQIHENKSIYVHLPHNSHIPHPSNLSSPQHFQAHPTTPGCTSNQNNNLKATPLNHTVDASRSTQSGHPLIQQAHQRLENLSAPAGNLNHPLKKNGKPLAQCPYCGMTFKKLEHCQRHERTHTLARPYPCVVCSKTFARQDTLNRHLRLHSRSEGRVAVNRSSAQSQELQASTSSPPSLNQPSNSPPRKLSCSISPSTDRVAVSGFLQSPHASPFFHRRQAARERGLSLSVLEHSSFPDHLSRDVPMGGNGHCQPISLPPQQPQQDLIPAPFHSALNCSQALSITPEISPQPLRSSKMCVDRAAALPTEVRRGSWCPGVPNLHEFASFSTNERPPLQSIRNHHQLALQPSLGFENWEANLTTTFGLVEAGIAPVPLSAPATCTRWSTLGIESGVTGNNSSLVIPTWESPSQFEIQPQNKLNWQALSRLEEEEQFKPETEQNHPNSSQLILSSPSQPDLFDQPNYVDPNYLTGLSTSIVGTTEPEPSPSFWGLSSGSNLPCQSSSQCQPPHPVSANHNEMVDCLGDHWSTPQKQTLGMFNPVVWRPSPCHDGEDYETRVLSDNRFPNLNLMTINNAWENNPSEEIFELGF